MMSLINSLGRLSRKLKLLEIHERLGIDLCLDDVVVDILEEHEMSITLSS